MICHPQLRGALASVQSPSRQKRFAWEPDRRYESLFPLPPFAADVRQRSWPQLHPVQPWRKVPAEHSPLGSEQQSLPSCRSLG